VDLPLLLGIDKHGLVRSQCVIAMLESLFIITDADVCCQMRQLGKEQPFAIDVCLVLRLCPRFLRLSAELLHPCPNVAFAGKAAAIDRRRNITLPPSHPIGLRITTRQTNEALGTGRLRANVPRRPSLGQMVVFPHTCCGAPTCSPPVLIASCVSGMGTSHRFLACG
jgi:hypothetical protein